MGKLYWYLLLITFSSVAVLKLPETTSVFQWWVATLVILNLLALPYWVTKTIESIKQLDINKF